MKLYDFAMAEEPDGSMLLHTAFCPYVRKLAEQGQFVGTMLGCRGVPDMLPRHSCLDNVENARSAAG